MLEIIAKLAKDDLWAKNLNELYKDNFQIRFSKKSAIIGLPILKHPRKFKRVPIDEAKYYVNCSEFWFKQKMDLYVAVLVAGFSGKELDPYFIPKKSIMEDKGQAYFSMPHGIISVKGFFSPNKKSSFFKKELVSIDRFAIEKDSEGVWLSKTRYFGTRPIDELADNLRIYEPCCRAAVQKAMCASTLSCPHIHYSSKKE